MRTNHRYTTNIGHLEVSKCKETIGWSKSRAVVLVLYAGLATRSRAMGRLSLWTNQSLSSAIYSKRSNYFDASGGMVSETEKKRGRG